ncbi:TPA: hypothetical protein ACH3X2_013874 [Trebouxia sp. C0005]
MSGRAYQLAYGTQEDHRGILLVATYCGIQDQLHANQASKDIQLTTSDGQQLSTFTSICRYLSSQSSKSQQLLGATPLDRATVQDWLSFRNIELHGLSEAQLLKANIPSAQIIDRYPSLFRWFDFLQHTVDPAGHYKRVDVRKPKFQRAPAPPAPVAKAEKAKAADAQPTTSSTSNTTAQPVKESKGAKAKSTSAAAGSTKERVDAEPAATTTAASGHVTDAATPVETPANASKTAGAAPSEATLPKQDGASKQQKGKEAPAAAKKAGDDPTIDMLDIRIGQIVSVKQHPNADSLYVEEVDLGEDKPRQIVSGLVKFVSVEQMQNRRVVVVTNLKPAKMRDVMSYGMVLCASNDAHDQVEPILPPEGVPLGEKVSFEGYEAEPEAQLNPKKKIFEKISPDLKTGADGTAQYKSAPFMTSKGPVISTLSNASVK